MQARGRGSLALLVYPVAMPVETKQLDSGVAVVAVSGRLVLGRELERLETAVKSLLAAGQKRFVFDLGALDYADSAGIGTFVACLTQIRQGQGEMRLAAANPRIQRLFQLTGIDHLMSMYPSVAEAASAG
jgi:anti-sigma B factor antagonist